MQGQLRQDVADTGQLGLFVFQLFLGLFPAGLIFGDAGRFFKDQTPILRLGAEQLVDLSLPDHAVAVLADAGIHQELLHILQTAAGSVDHVFAFAGPVKAAADDHLVVIDGKGPVLVAQKKSDLGKTKRLASFGTGKNNIFHAAAAQGLGALLAQYPAYCVRNIALAAAVGADDSRHTFSEFHPDLVRKGLEPHDLDRC